MKISKNGKNLQESNKRRLEEIRKAEKEREAECILKINNHVKFSINACTNNLVKTRLFEAEKEIYEFTYEFGRMLIGLYLISFHLNVDYMKWLSQGKYYLKAKIKYRQLKTMFGEVIYGRCYLENKTGEKGIYASDKELSITRDGFSPQVIKYVTNLSTRMSFKSTCELFKRFCNWAPTTESVQKLVLGLGSYGTSFMKECGGIYEDDGEVLVIEADGKATPTATEEELKKRRGKRKKKKGCKMWLPKT